MNPFKALIPVIFLIPTAPKAFTSYIKHRACPKSEFLDNLCVEILPFPWEEVEIGIRMSGINS
jgi:hypothetical protein